MSKIIRLSKSCLSSKEKRLVKEILDKEFLGMGPEVKYFENELKSFFNREVVCFNSGTAALQVALQSIGIKANDEDNETEENIEESIEEEVEDVTTDQEEENDEKSVKNDSENIEDDKEE